MRRALLLLALGATGCTKNHFIDLAMSTAPHHAPQNARVGPYRVLAGDLHCHVLPPDSPWHVSRDLAETARLADEEGLDFVVLTPHVYSRFFMDAHEREWVRSTQAALRASIAALPTRTLLIAGMEYTDGWYGHAGLAFADVGAVLDALAAADLQARPELFLEAWHAHGGTVTINHPVLRALPRAPVRELRGDLSWRGFPRADEGATQPLPPDIRWITEHADAIETWNESVGHLRDRLLVDDADRTIREAAHLVDRMARHEQRPITPVGGTDSHGDWLRPTTWVLATERTPAAIRDAIVHGRTCVRGPDACSLQVTNGTATAFVSGSIASGPNHDVEAHVRGEATYFVNGEMTRGPRLAVSGRCSLVRVAIGASMSAPIYVDCPWSGPRE